MANSPANRRIQITLFYVRARIDQNNLNPTKGSAHGTGSVLLLSSSSPAWPGRFRHVCCTDW